MAETPKLLSGGNPQIPKADGEAPVTAYLAAMPGWKKAVGERLDALIVSAVPDIEKGVRWNQPMYGVEGKGWIVSFRCFTQYVKIHFFNGSQLMPPPPGQFKAEGERYLKIFENDDLDETQLTDWFRQATQYEGWAYARQK